MHTVFRILGPFEAEVDGRVVTLGRRERALLGVLLLNEGEVVSVERLIDGVWGDVPPSSAKHMVHEYVSRLRAVMGDASRIETRVPGYVVMCADGELDSKAFRKLAGDARAAAGAQGDGEALRSYEQALALWRGSALAGVELEGDAQIDVGRLDEERRLVAEERIDCALALGRHRELVPELERAVVDEPLRERSRAQLMLALYRAGRQAEALERYREGRTLLVERAGIEPGPELRRLERAILQHDPGLEVAQPVLDARQPPSGRYARRRSTRWALASGALLLAAAVVALAFASGHPDSARPLARIDANSAGAIDPGNNRLVAQVHTQSGPGRVAAGFGSLWVVNDFDSTVSRINPVTGSKIQTIQVDPGPTAIAVGAGFVWVACTGSRSVNRISPEVNRRVQRIPVGNGPSGIAIGPGTVWVTNRLDDTVTEIDSRTGRFRRRLAAGPSPSDVAYGLGALWISNESSSTVSRLDPGSGELREIPVGNGPEAVTTGYGHVWVANGLDGTVSRVDPGTDVVTTFTVGAVPSSVLASNGSIWVADSYDGKVVRVDPTSNHIIAAIGTGSGPQSLASIDDRIWLSAREATTLHRGGTLRLFDLNAPETLDAGTGYLDGSIQTAIGDGLVGFKRVSGLDGGTLVPDLALSLPAPTGHGRTYTFRMRPRIRYSNGDPVRASDLRRALERDLRIGGGIPESELVGNELVGGDACSKSHCDLSRGVVADDRAGTVTLHLRRPDPELVYKLALPTANPVPRGVSMTRPSRLGVPGTGPYAIQSYGDSKLVLVRNPYFREWSAAAQPDGSPDRIVKSYYDELGKPLTDEHELGKRLTAIEHGKADLMTAPLPASRLSEIRTRYAAQVHVFPSATTFAIFLSTRIPPFDNLDARRAVSYAIDRNAAVAGFGGAGTAAVTCQILPAGMPGYRPYCPFTRRPNAGGIWQGPDLAAARKLIARSGTQGQKVVFWTGEKPLQMAIGKIAVETLRRLGYRATLKVVGHDAYFGAVYDSRNRTQAGFDGWSPDYPRASNFFVPLFTCRAFQPGSAQNTSTSGFCSYPVDRAVDRALTRLTSDAPGASSVAWSAVDRLVTDAAPWVPLVNMREVVFVSRRVHNLQVNPQWGVLVDQISLR